jgi:hypothetical protein
MLDIGSWVLWEVRFQADEESDSIQVFSFIFFVCSSFSILIRIEGYIFMHLCPGGNGLSLFYFSHGK